MHQIKFIQMNWLATDKEIDVEVWCFVRETHKLEYIPQIGSKVIIGNYLNGAVEEVTHKIRFRETVVVLEERNSFMNKWYTDLPNDLWIEYWQKDAKGRLDVYHGDLTINKLLKNLDVWGR